VNLGICAIVKDERISYASEWVQWYRELGVKRFFIYNNGVEPFVTGPDIVETAWPGKAVQLAAYDHCLAYNQGMDFIAFIDLDEFIVGPLISKLEHVENGLALNWRMYGSSGLNYNHQGRQLGVFRKYAPPTACETVKTIVRVNNAIQALSPHHFLFRNGKGVQSLNGAIVSSPINPISSWPEVWINHYILRSKADWFYKAYRGRVSVKDTCYDVSTIEGIDKVCTETDEVVYWRGIMGE